MKPSAELDLNLSPGVVAEKSFIEQLETNAEHSQEDLDEEDAFLGSAAPEVWEYAVVDSRVQEFEEALENSDLVLEYDVVDDTPTTADEVSRGVLSDDGVYPRDGSGDSAEAADATEEGSGVRAGDDGPAGMPTADPSAGGLGGGSAPLEYNQANSGGIDDLHVTTADDPTLGLTDIGEVPPQDWAANSGPSRNPSRSVAAANIQDKGSTLRPARAGR